MKRSFLSTVLCGALIGFSGYVFADTTEANPGGGRPAWGQGGRGGMGGMRGQGRWRGQGGQGRWRGQGGPGMRGGMGFGGMMFNRISKESEIQQKFPEEYAKAAKQLIEAESKLQELAQKAKVELPVDNNYVFRQLKAKAPAEFAEIENKLKQRETMREGFEKLRALAEKHKLKLSFGFGFGMRPGMRGPEAQQPGDRPRMRRNDVAKINAVRERYPAEWKKVLELRQQNKHGEARALTRELIQRLDAPGKTAPQQPAGK